MADEKFDNLSARIFQGYDPNTEFKEKGAVFSTAVFSDGSYSQEASALNAVQPSNGNTFNAQTIIPAEHANASASQSTINFLNSSTSLPFPDNTASNSFGDFLSSGSGGSFTPESLEGSLYSQGGLQSSQPAQAQSLSRVESVNGSNTQSTNTMTTTNDNPHLDAPQVTATGSETNEGDPIPLSITVTQDSQQGVSTLVTIVGVPSDAMLSAGTLNQDGSWTLTIGQLSGLVLTPNPTTSGDITLSVTAVSRLNDMTASDTENFKVTIDENMTAPILDVHNVTGMEDSAIALNINSSAGNGETLTVTITNVPANATLSAGTHNQDGTWTLTQVQLTNLTLTPPHNYSGTIALDVTATSTDGTSSSTAHSGLNVNVYGVADVPTVSVQAASGLENSHIPLVINAALTDTDGSEVLSVIIGGLQNGFSLSAGTDNSDGTWTLTPSQLTNLELIPAANFNGSVNLQVLAVASENNTNAYANATMSVTISPTAGSPTLATPPSSGNEDTPIALDIQANNTSNGAVLSVVVTGVPSGASLSAGTDNGNGTWSLIEAQLTNLTITPPHNYSGSFNLGVTATSTENGTTASSSNTLSVTVDGVPDVPTLSVQAASGNEGTPIALNISTALTDTDGSETLSIGITGVPVGATLSAGTNNGGGSWTLTLAQLTNLTLTPPANYSGNFNLNVIATSSENSQTASTSGTALAVHVDGVATTPTLSTSSASGNEDTAIPLTINAALVDNDGSETLSVTIAGVPTGATLSAGTNNGGGSWTLTQAQLTNLTITPPHNYSGGFDLSVTATSSENATTASTSPVPLHVDVAGVPDVPTLSVQAASGNEGTPIALNISAALTDTDGSETLSITVSGVPTGATLSAGMNNGNGSWTLTSAQLTNLSLTPPANYSGNFSLGVVATSSENNQTASTGSSALAVHVEGVATTPTLSVSSASGNEDTVIPLTINAGLVDNDGSETLGITITGVPTGATLSAGTNNGGGSWTLTSAQLTNLTLTPPHNFSGNFDLSVTATSSENATTASTSTMPLHVSVAGVPDMPTLSVQAASGNENSAINLNIAAALTDTDGSETLSVTVAGVPAGATLSAGTNNGNGSWTLTSAQLSNLMITPPAHFTGNFNLSVTATASENSQSISTNASSMAVHVDPVSNPPVLIVNAASGNEDTPISLSINAAPFDPLDGETLSLVVSGVPTGATLSAGTNNSNGTWSLTPAQLTNLKITPPHDYSGNFNLTVALTSTNGGSSATVSSALNVAVAGVPDVPTLSVTSSSGNEASPIALHITSALTDTDGSETLSIGITGVPAGATLSAGTNNGGGSWTLTPAQLTNLTITPPANYSGNFNLGVTATASENNLTATTSASSLAVHVDGVATTPTLSVSSASGNEDTAIPLTINSALVDNDGSETLSVTITGVPTGATLSAGTNNGSGSWTLAAAQLTNLKITPPLNYSGNFDLSVTATSSENATTASTSTVPLHVSVAGVPDVPILSVSPASGNEGTAIALTINAALTDTDGSETLSVTITGVPTGATLSAGTNNGGGSWTLTPTQLTNLKITPPAYYSGNFNLGVVATSSENSQTASTSSSTLAVHVDGVASTPILSVHNVTGNEDTAISLNIAAALTDTDGSETLTVSITGVPTGATLSAGTNNGGGSWTLTQAQMTNLKLTPPLNYSGDITLGVTAVSHENATTASTPGTMVVHVAGVADTPTLTVSNTAGNEDTAIPLTINAALTDTDGSEKLSITVSGVPTGAVLSAGLNNGDGSWTLTSAQLSSLSIMPPSNFSGTMALQVTAVSTENNGDHASLTAPLTITVTPVADAPTLTVAAVTGREDTGIALNIGAALTDLDGSETLSIAITGVPTGAILSAGTNNGGGSWTLTQGQLTNLKITPPLNNDNDFTLSVTAIATDSNGSTSSTVGSVAVTVTGVADVPTVTATNTTGAINTAVSMNISGAVIDNDGSESLTYLISGVPDGFSLNHGTNNGNNTWTLQPVDLSGLKIISPYNFEGRVNMTAQSISHDNDNSVAQSLGANFNVGIGNASGGIQLNLGVNLGIAGIGAGTTLGVNVNTGGLLNPGGLVVYEDSTSVISDAGLLINLVSGLTGVTFTGLPTGASLSAGVNQGGGSYYLTTAQLSGVQLILPPNSDQDFTLTAKAVVLGIPLTLATVPVHVIGVADTPTLGVANATGNEDAASIPISVTSALNRYGRVGNIELQYPWPCRRIYSYWRYG